MRRREFLKSSGLAVGAAMMAERAAGAGAQNRPRRPNILWISVEDISPDLGCYGDPYAVTPNLDRLATQGTRFTRCFTHMGVCAPSRSGLITGMYPTCIGTNHMRCRGVPPEEARCFPEYLRAAGYYCTNRSKTDYQFASPPTAWDICGRCDDWRGRAPGQPFFCVINLTTTHESQIRSAGRRKQIQNTLSPSERHDPAKAKLPPYYPDTPAVRRDWAQYYDIITLMDKQVGQILQALEADGLAEDTIVWFWGDHGRGLPRAKRWIYDSGLLVPLIIRVPQKWRAHANPENPDALRPGTVNDDLVAFLDFAPTMLSLCNVPIPKHLQGQAFLGPQKANKPRDHIYGARDRVDEAYDVIRCVRDKRFKYIRNFMPHLPRSLDVAYMNQMPTMAEMRRLFAEGKLKGPELQYFERPKPLEELYDTQTDPHEVHNLASDPRHRDTLTRLREELFRWMEQMGDFGLLPECDFDKMKWPEGRQEKTTAPGVKPLQAKGGGATVELSCLTPGASIAYRLSGAGRRGNRWLVYSRPLAVRPGQTLSAKACRLGFKDSATVTWKPGQSAIAPEPCHPHPHWRKVLVESGIVRRILRLKRLEGDRQRFLAACVSALTGKSRDPAGPVRYWAVLGIHHYAAEAERGKYFGLLRAAAGDESFSVRVAAAEALCDWGHQKEGLPILVEGLKERSASAALLAATALYHLGAKAGPAAQALRAAAKTGGYVARMAQHILRRIG